jgi:hypothetical protein
MEIDKAQKNSEAAHVAILRNARTNIVGLLEGKKMHQLPRNSCETAGRSCYEHLSQATSFRDTSAIFIGKNPPAIR